MIDLNIDRTIFGASCICMALLSVTILLMPMAAGITSESQGIPLYFNGILFWMTALGGYILIFILNRRRKAYIKDKEIKTSGSEMLPGIIRFFSNPHAKVIDTIFILSLFAFIYYQATNNIDGFLSYVLLSTLLFAFHMHCMFNGRNYYYIQNDKKGE